MSHPLAEIMSGLTTLTKEEKNDIETSFPVHTFSKGHYLLKEEHIAKDAFFVVTGCVREYKNGEDGTEKTIAFYTENQSVVNFSSLVNKTPSKINFVCTEETTLAVLNATKEKELYQKHPRFETFCRSGVEQMLGEKQEEITELMLISPEERYLKLQQNRPDLINRVPQYQIASYLGIQPETLSRIRKRNLKK